MNVRLGETKISLRNVKKCSKINLLEKYIQR